jgi:hypothetical protein
MMQTWIHILTAVSILLGVAALLDQPTPPVAGPDLIEVSGSLG